MEEDPVTEELRIDQAERESAERRAAQEAAEEADTHAHAARADKAEYLRRKLEERARSERERG